ncbi:MAG: SPOR domain-containing protein [Gammaproteobacteria bacterium]
MFYSLLMCNGLFFAWQWLHGGSKPAEFVVEIPRGGTVNQLRLLSEVNPRELRPRARAAADSIEAKTNLSSSQQVNHASPSSSAAPYCYSLGPIATDDEMEQLRTWVMAAGGAPQLRLGERRELALYWVYLPPFSTRTEALRVAQEMARLGIKDIFVIPRGDMTHAVSLGVYARNSSLERRLRQLKAKGYDASVLPRYRVEAASWIDAKFQGSKGFARQRFNTHFPQIEVTTISCETLLSDEHSTP